MAGLRDPFLVLVMVVVVQFFGFTYGCSSTCPPSACPDCSGVKYQVGSLWSLPPFPTYYSNWSLSHFFKTGDFLGFDFETGHNDVIQVSRQEYESCTACNPLRVINIGPALVPLAEKGVFYFISNFSNYCGLGLKVSVWVHDCSDGLQPTPSPSPSPSPLRVPPPSSPAPAPRTRNGSNSPAPTPAPSPDDDGYPPEAGAPPNAKSMAIRVGSSEILIFRWAFDICLVVFVILGSMI
ncbi:blue copper protein-like [Juglans microcarpa x Juglans regia]|uniref:blue copper protein-like n=1 Tax=Juglans microcarpa x Juglans regia TaxID=2249226 RepID=UPI001B7F2DC6|nr:blue copper protein-like [Juglans microcarpa x Juglans regia]